MKWQVIGPFDNTEREGFDTAFPPEKEIKLDATYDGKSGAGEVAGVREQATNTGSSISTSRSGC